MTLHVFLKDLNHQKQKLTLQQYKTIRGQALAGDIQGASKGLGKLMC